MSFFVILAIFMVNLSGGKGEPPQSVTVGGIFLSPQTLLAEVFLESVSHLNSDDRILPLTMVRASSTVSSPSTMSSPFSMSSPSSMSVHSSSCSTLSVHSMAVVSGCGVLDSVVASVTGHSHIPHLSTEIVPKAQASIFSLYLGPSVEHMDRAVQDILRRKQADKVLIVTHKTTGILNVQSLLESLQVSEVEVWVADVDSKVNQWDNLINRGVKVIIVDIGIQFVHLFVDKALETRILNRDCTVIFTSLDFSSMDLERVRWTGANLLGFSLLNRNTIEDGYIDRDFPGLVTLQTLLKRDHRAALIFDSVNLFGKALDFLVEKTTPPLPKVSCLDDEEVYAAGEQFLDVLKNISLVGVTGNIAFSRSHRKEIKLYVQQIVDQGLIRTVGSWTSHVDRHQPELLLNQIQANRKQPGQLTRKKNKIKVKSPLGNFLRESKEQGKERNEKYYGFIKDLLDGIMNQLEFDYELLVGDREESDKVQVDIELGDLTMTSQGSSMKDFSVPFMTSEIVAVTKKSSLTSHWSLMTVWSPFPLNMWLTLLFCFSFSSLLVLVVATVSPYERHSTTSSPHLKIGFLNAGWLSVSGLLLKSVNVPVQAVSTRAICCFCWMLSLLILLLYSSSLHGLFSPQDEDQALNNLLQEEDVTFGVISNGTTHHLIQKSGDPNLQALLTKLSPIDSVAGGLARVLSEDKFIFLIESPQVPLSRHCDLDTVGTFGRVHYGFTFRKGSPLTRIFNSGLLEMAEKGDIKQLIEKWLPHKSCPDMHAQAANELPFYGCLLFLLLSAFACLLISFLELVYFSAQSSRGSCWQVLKGELESMVPGKKKDECRSRSPVYLKDIYANNHINITDSPFKSSNDEESPVRNGYSSNNSPIKSDYNSNNSPVKNGYSSNNSPIKNNYSYSYKQCSNEQSPVKNGYCSNNEDNSVTDSNIHLLNYKQTNGNTMFQN